MNNLKLLFGIATISLLSACSSAPERGGEMGTDNEVFTDTAPGLEGSEIEKGGVEVLPADASGQVGGQQIDDGQKLDDMQMIDVDSIYEPVIYFAYDQYELNDAGLKDARYQADLLAANPSQIVILNGHTDERGTPEYNLALGEKRAKSVEQALMLYGVSQNRIEVISFGEEQPAEIGNDEAAWQKNRRVNIVIK